MSIRLFVLAIVCAAIPAAVRAQTVELVSTPGVVRQAVELKKELRVERVESYSALALVGASAEQKRAYAAKVAATTAVVIVGEDALTAVADIEFTVPVITVNANGKTAARNRVIRVFDTTIAAPAGTETVRIGDSIAKLVGNNRFVSLQGPVAPIVQALVMALK